MNKLFWILMAFVAGSVVPLQAGLNAKLGKAGGSTVYASLISFIVGTAALFLYIFLTKQNFSWAGVKEAPAIAWVGGILGAFFVTVIVLCFPQIGPGLTFGLIVAGQMIVSAFLEHYNILVAEPHPVSWLRLLGIMLVVVGVIIIRQF
jgi:bacterial/archaeal transporter family-2 protein